jgi:hypothetical protein
MTLSTGQEADGKLAEMAIYNRVLSGTELTQAYNYLQR